ncbi:MAG: hypothetical protein LDL27_10310, partial [Desulfovibrio sp.]|nr:hypothetical protein [Desulfovibrio sp.]
MPDAMPDAPEDAPEDAPVSPPMAGDRVLGIKFREHGQLYFFHAAGLAPIPGEHVVVETEQGLSMGQVVLALDRRDQIPSDYAKDLIGQELKPILRLADAADLDRHAENLDRGRDAWHVCRRLVREHGLDMKLVDVEVLHDQSKILFYFTAPNRIDFRELVKDLVKEFHTRIELRQIGVRHETQMIGAIGNCGLVCCCRQFLRKFAPVTIKMAKEQNLFLNPTKISGMCGRLLCCLSFEQENYEQFHKQCPKIGKKYLTTMGPVKVLRANFFRNSLSVYVEGDEEREVTLEDWEAMDPRRPDPNQQQQMQQEQAARAARPDRSDRPDRADRADRQDRGSRADRSERGARPSSPGQAPRPDRPRPDKPRKERIREERRQEQSQQAQAGTQLVPRAQHLPALTAPPAGPH